MAVDAEQVPGSVQAGSVVDVYLVSEPGGKPGPALSAVTVVDAPPLEQSFAATGKRQLVLAVEEQRRHALLPAPRLLGRLGDHRRPTGLSR